MDYLDILLLSKVLQSIYVGSLPIGNTNSKIDQTFSTKSLLPRTADYVSMEELEILVGKCFKDFWSVKSPQFRN